MNIPEVILSTFNAAKDITYYESKWAGEDKPPNKTITSHVELGLAIALGRSVLAESEKDCSGVFSVIGINKNNKDLVIAIKDGLIDIAELLKKYTSKRNSFFARTGNLIVEIGEKVDTTTKFFRLFSSSLTTDSTPKILPSDVIQDPKALCFWKAYFGDETFVLYNKFIDALVNHGVDVANIRITDQNTNEFKIVKKLRVTLFVFERSLKFCIDWDGFKHKCQTPGEVNPILAVVNTNSRVSPNLVTSDTMPPRESKNAPYSGQAAFGSFYIMSKQGFFLTTLGDGTSVGSQLAAALPSGASCQEWSFRKLSLIQHFSSKLYVGFHKDTTVVEGSVPCLTPESEVVGKLQKWRINPNGTISCAGNRDLVLEISNVVLEGRYLGVSMRPYRAGAPEQLFKIVNYAPAFSPALKPPYLPMPGDCRKYSPTPYNYGEMELYRRNYPTITTN